MNENKKLVTDNTAWGFVVFIVGLPLAFYLILPGIMSDFGPGETWVSRAGKMSLMVAVVYFLVSYILGKIKPAFSWRSGLMLASAPILASIFMLLNVIINLPEAILEGYFKAEPLLIFVPLIVLAIVSPLGSWLASRSRLS